MTVFRYAFLIPDGTKEPDGLILITTRLIMTHLPGGINRRFLMMPMI